MSALLVILLAGQILSEPFDDPKALEKWDRMDGAVAGEGPYSKVSLDSGALLFECDAETHRWYALTRTVPLGGAKWVRVSGRIKTEGLAPDKAAYTNSNLILWMGKVGTGPLVGTRPIVEDSDWTTVARRLAVPEGATEITVGCFFSIPGRAWFDDVTVEAVEPPKWETAKTGHYTYRWLGADRVSEQAREYNEGSYEIMSKFFEVPAPVAVTYTKYPDLESKEEYTGIRGNAHRTGDEIHSIWATDRHEIVHVLCGGWGDPPAILGEGIAVYLSGEWQRLPLPDAARKVAEGDRWISPGEILDTRAFRRHPEEATYAISGAFVLWIVETHGKEALRKLYGTLRNDAPAEQNRQAFQEVLGVSIAEAESKFRSSLGLE